MRAFVPCGPVGPAARPGSRRFPSYGTVGGPVQAAVGLGRRCAAAFAGVLLLALGAAAGPGQAEPARAEAPLRIVAFGDSLTAGYGLPPGQAFPDLLQKALATKGRTAAGGDAPARPVEIVNAGVSGDTVADGLARLDWAVGDDTDAVILELGANDALRGLDPAGTRRGLDAILRRLHARGIPVLLAGMRAPPNMGKAYGEAFDVIFPDLAKAYDSVLYPFFLEGVAADRSLNQPDGIHPNAAGVRVIVDRILPRVDELIGLAEARRGHP